MRERDRSRGQKAALYGMLISLGFVFSYVEAMIPVPMPAPGMKLGLANLVGIVGLYTIGVTGVVIISLVRIVLVGFTFGNTFSMIYGLAGGAVSLLAMIGAKKSGWFGTVGVSIFGGVFHNVGQLAVAAFVTRTGGVFIYLPALLAAGVTAGAVIGLLGGVVADRIRPMMGGMKDQ
ncbi:Gx transporter family protein [Clostridiaceae bacterium]|nr:Gx transporter family protein [Clostridiaceae bacterium]